MLGAVEEVRGTGEVMSAAAREFANDPCSSVKRGNMVRASRNLLSAVTRLLILADMIDVHLLLKKLRRVEDDLEYLKSVSSQAELMDGMSRSRMSLRAKFWRKTLLVFLTSSSQVWKISRRADDPGSKAPVRIEGPGSTGRLGGCTSSPEEAQHDVAHGEQGLCQAPRAGSC